MHPPSLPVLRTVPLLRLPKLVVGVVDDLHRPVRHRLPVVLELLEQRLSLGVGDVPTHKAITLEELLEPLPL